MPHARAVSRAACAPRTKVSVTSLRHSRAAIKHVVAVAAADLGWIPRYWHAGRNLGAERDQPRLLAPPVHRVRLERRRTAVSDSLAEQARAHQDHTHRAHGPFDVAAQIDLGRDIERVIEGESRSGHRVNSGASTECPSGRAA
jgi:hypothetical protein